MERHQEEEIMKELRTTTEQLHGLWNEIGFDEVACNERREMITAHIKDLLKTMWEQENKLKKKLLSSIEDNGQEFYQLNKELGTTLPDPEENLSLLELERYLRHNVKQLQDEVKKRRLRIRDLRQAEQELCERLIEEPSNVVNKPIPSLDDMEDLERRIRTLEQEKINREKTFQHLKSNIAKLMEELEQKANTTFERDILSEVEGLFTLSQQNLKQMKHLNEEYEQRVKDNKNESLELHERIRLLSDRLGLDPSERDQFLATADGHTPSTLAKLRAELSRLQELKQQNMARFINQLRRELETWWEKCYITDEEKNAFLPYLSEVYTEEILEAHDAEVQRLQEYYTENERLFLKIKQRQEVWNKLMELEEKANDPNRLFGNRGCSLLQEEKERKRVRNELPRIEKELEDLVLQWEVEKGKPFLLGEQSVSEYIQNQWEKYKNQKEKEKKDRQNARAKQLNMESRLGTRTPTVKRRIARNDTLRTSKIRRIGEESPGQSTTLTPTNATRRTVLREQNQNTLKNTTVQKFAKKDGTLSSNDISTYSHFSDGIQRRSERENIRSSTVHGANKAPLLVCRPSPRRPPPGLPKTPKTLPRVATRRSPRFSAPRASRHSPRSTTVSRMVSPASSSTFKSPRAGTPRATTPNRWSKLSFLI
ncbi:protein regulator of cytokinesis 1 [Penaeus vannamei]|uniref:protein regulator of cytokinesis 1 n=1 Tax=Penaeus vannamei TaxID=6689 RepID=UPI000F68856D|nr:protein regulator of cytokinesis 1-like [Penaeus vannamei]XP_027211220.1 protein regulator of cytokinesis 1-like [Penaeus vannamei]